VASPWHTMPDDVPDDEEPVWVRRWYYGAPSLATYYADTATFTYDGGLTLPWYEISRWRHVEEP